MAGSTELQIGPFPELLAEHRFERLEAIKRLGVIPQ